MSENPPFKLLRKIICLSGLIAVSLLLVSLIIPACSKETRYEPSPEEIISLLLEFPPVPVPPVTPANESTTELETAISMGLGYVDMEMHGFRTFISHVQNTEAYPLDGKRGFRWIRDSGKVTSIDLRAWIEEEVQFEMDYALPIPSHFYPTKGWFTPSLSDGELQHQTMTMEWSTDEVGLSLDIDSALGSFAAFDSTRGGGWVRYNSKGGLPSGHGAKWDANGNITISYWISSGL